MLKNGSTNKSRKKMSTPKVLRIDPSTIKFEVDLDAPDTTQSTIKKLLRLTNLTDEPVIFKLKTTMPKRYYVKPFIGHINARETQEVGIHLILTSQLPEKDKSDKFQVLSSVISEEEYQNIKKCEDAQAEQAYERDLFSKLEKTSNAGISKQKLKAVILDKKKTEEDQAALKLISHESTDQLEKKEEEAKPSSDMFHSMTSSGGIGGAGSPRVRGTPPSEAASPGYAAGLIPHISEPETKAAGAEIVPIAESHSLEREKELQKQITKSAANQMQAIKRVKAEVLKETTEKVRDSERRLLERLKKAETDIHKVKEMSKQSSRSMGASLFTSVFIATVTVIIALSIEKMFG